MFYTLNYSRHSVAAAGYILFETQKTINTLKRVLTLIYRSGDVECIPPLYVLS